MRPRALLAIFVFVVAANVPLWIAGHSLGLMVRGLFGVEFVIVGLLSVLLARWAVAGLLLLAMLEDLLCAICKTYLFSVADLLRSCSNVAEVAPAHVLSILLIVVSIAAACAGSVVASQKKETGRHRGYFAASLLALLAVGLAIDSSRGQLRGLHPDRQLGQLRLVRNPVRTLVLDERRYRALQQAAAFQTDAAIEGASSALGVLGQSTVREAGAALRPGGMLRPGATLRPAAWIPSAGDRPNVVLVLVESWGQPLAHDLEESLIEPYKDEGLAAAYTMQRGTVSFYGPTVAGEMRELCGSRLGFGVMGATAERLRDCLPGRFDRMGYL